MDLQGLWAWYGDYERLRWLEKFGQLPAGISAKASERIAATLERVVQLAAIDRVIPYDGPVEA